MELFISINILARGILIHLDCGFLYIFLILLGFSDLVNLFRSLSPFLCLRTLDMLVSFCVICFVFCKLGSGMAGAGLGICDDGLLDGSIVVR